MDVKWKKMYEAAKAVQNGREISENIYAGGVAAAVESAPGKIYVGVCVDNSDYLIRKDPFFYSVSKGKFDYNYIENIVE